MTANGSAGNRDGFEAWVAALQRAPGAERKSEPDITAALVNDSATHVQQIPKELIHKLRERETQGLLGVETERTAVFRPPPELLARAKRMRPPSKPASPSDVPPAEHAEIPTAPPPEAAVPTVRPPPPQVKESLDDGWAELDSGLEALKPIAARAIPASHSARPVAPKLPSAAPRLPVTAAPLSKPSAPVAVARTVDVVKSVDAALPTLEPASDLTDMLDEPTRLRADGFAALLGAQAPSVAQAPAPAPARTATPPMSFTAPTPPPREELESELTEPRVSGVVSQRAAAVDDSLAGDVGERGASGRRWVVIAAVFLALVIIGLAALAR